jgi:hypothetical protein
LLFELDHALEREVFYPVIENKNLKMKKFFVAAVALVGVYLFPLQATAQDAIVQEGEIVLVLDTQEVKLRTGDLVVQRGTNHAWSNRSNAPCVVAFVLVDGKFDPELAAKF